MKFNDDPNKTSVLEQSAEKSVVKQDSVFVQEEDNNKELLQELTRIKVEDFKEKESQNVNSLFVVNEGGDQSL